VNILRRLPLSRLLLLCGVIVAVGIGATALALAVSAGPVPPPKPLAQAIHDALAAPPVSGVSARIQLTDHLIEGANLAGNGGGEAGKLASSPLLSGASGRLWVGQDGHARLELQSEKGDTQILYDGHTVSLYDASTNTLYRYTPPAREPTSGGQQDSRHNDKIPTVAQIQEGIDRLGKHANVSGATPTDVAGQAAYTVRISPRENGGLIAGAELSWDAVHGVPLRAAVYSTGGSSPVIELAATEISYGPVDASVFDYTPPADAKAQEVKLPARNGAHGAASAPAGSGPSAPQPSAPGTSGSSSNDGGGRPHVTVHGKGLAAIAVLESPIKPGAKSAGSLEGLRKVDINGTSASELPTALGTLLSFERAGVRYLLAGSVTPGTIEAFARGL
jgi:outer membrane lipoprotein-sorting protein